MQHRTLAGAAVWALSLAAGAHTALTALQLAPAGRWPCSDYGLERYTAFFHQPLAWALALHTLALWLAIK